LLSALCNGESFSPDCSIVPTVGVNIFSLSLEPKKSVHIRELGGALAPVWPTYLAVETAVIFVVDASDLFSLGMVATKLLETITVIEANAKRENKVGRLCLVWSKLDRGHSHTHKQTIRNILCLQDVVAASSLVITEVDWLMSSKGGLNQLEDWVRKATAGPPASAT